MFAANGNKVVFQSSATNLIPEDPGRGIFLVELGVALPPVTFSIAPQSVTVNEDGGTVTFTVSRSASTTAQTVYASTVQNQGAANNGDYTGLLNRPVAFAVGENEQTVTVQITDDAVVESDEVFGLIVQQSPSDPIDIFLASATFTIEDDDAPAPVVPSLSVDDISVGEGGGPAVFTVKLSQPTTVPVTVTYSTLIGTANADGPGTDYNGVVDQTLVFAPGETQKPVAITINDDDVDEPNETFQLLLENPTNATLSNARATATIVDDDEAPPDDFVVETPQLIYDDSVGAPVKDTIRDISQYSIEFAQKFLSAVAGVPIDSPTWQQYVNASAGSRALIFGEKDNPLVAASQLDDILSAINTLNTIAASLKDGDLDQDDRDLFVDLYVSLISGKVGSLVGSGTAVAVAGGTTAAAAPVLLGIGAGFLAATLAEYWISVGLEAFTDYERVDPTTLEQIAQWHLWDPILGPVGSQTQLQSFLSANLDAVGDDGFIPAWSYNVETRELNSLRDTDPDAWNQAAQRLGMDTGTPPVSLKLHGDSMPGKPNDLLIGGIGPDFIDGGRGDDRIAGLGGDDEIRSGIGNDEVLGGDGADTFAGEAADHDGDTIVDFTTDDRIVFTGAKFTKDDVTVTAGSAVLHIDTNGDGKADTTLTLLGDFSGAAFEVTLDGPDTVITLADAPVEPAIETASLAIVTAKGKPYVEYKLGGELQASVRQQDGTPVADPDDAVPFAFSALDSPDLRPNGNPLAFADRAVVGKAYGFGVEDGSDRGVNKKLIDGDETFVVGLEDDAPFDEAFGARITFKVPAIVRNQQITVEAFDDGASVFEQTFTFARVRKDGTFAFETADGFDELRVWAGPGRDPTDPEGSGRFGIEIMTFKIDPDLDDFAAIA